MASKKDLVPYIIKFEWVGTDDDSTYSLVPGIINCRNDFAHGEVKITKYLHILAVWSGLYLSRKWDSEIMFSACRKDSELSLEELETRLKVWLDLFSKRLFKLYSSCSKTIL
jgi:hypothetical protein